MQKALDVPTSTTAPSSPKSRPIKVRFGPCARRMLILLLMALLLVSLPVDTFAQGEAPARDDRTKASYNESNRKGWEWAASKCTDASTDQCAHAAIVQVTLQCGASTKWLKKNTRAWQGVSFGLVVASAVFTAIGASTTIANAKVYSTLGGTTGLGAVTTTINANVASDQAALAAVNTAITNFLKFVQTGGANNGPADNKLIYKSAPLYAAQCSAAANSSTGTGSK